jgi:hypothetical protein
MLAAAPHLTELARKLAAKMPSAPSRFEFEHDNASFLLFDASSDEELVVVTTAAAAAAATAAAAAAVAAVTDLFFRG